MAGVLIDPHDAEARGESPYCASLKAQIANADGGGRIRAAAAKQRAELNRTAAYARGIGCDRQQFLIFGEAPPPQCGQLQARVSQMSANLSNLQQSEEGGAAKAALVARYDAECRNAPPPPRPEHSFLDDIFGGGTPMRDDAPPAAAAPGPHHDEFRDPFDDSQPVFKSDDLEQPDDRPRGGSEAICVRQCDGGFFPLSYSARNANMDQLAELCHALCPGGEARIYTKSPWKDVETAFSVDGESYADHPNALKFQKQRVAGCGCKPVDKSWTESLEEAERILTTIHSQEQVVSAEEAERLSRPQPANGVSRPDAKKQSTRRDAQRLLTSATPSDNAPSEAPTSAREDSVYRDVTGPDGIRRRVRVIAPTL
jgi:hypothetical protein